MNESAEYQRRLSDAMESLVGIAWMERACSRAADPSCPTVSEMFITRPEVHGLQERICMADDLAVGAFGGKSKGSMAAVAKALVALSLAPGGVPFCGKRYRTESWGPGVRLVIEPDRGVGSVPATLTETMSAAMSMLEDMTR